MASLIVKITGDASGFRGAMDGANRALDSVATKADKVSGAIGSLGTTMSVGLTAPILALGAGVIKTAADMESLRLGLASVAKGADTTEVQLARLKEVAKLPGLGFSEAIQGSVRLQSAGFSAQLAERSLKAFGNALATVGKGKADLDGVTLALSQIASKGKISAEEINQLAERVPQIRVAMKAAFGTADTEVLQKAGIGAEEFVTRVVAQLEKLKQVSGGTKNSLENLADKFKETADRIGSKMLPAVNELLPKLESLAGIAGDAVEGFARLPNEVQNTALALTAVAIAAGPVIKAFQSMQAGLASIQLAAGLAGVGLATLFGAVVIAGIAQTMSAIDQLRAKTKAYYDDLDRRRTGKQDIIAGQENAGLGGVRTRESFIITEASNAAVKYKIDLKALSDELGLFGQTSIKAKEDTLNLADAYGKTAKSVTLAYEAHKAAKPPTMDLLALFERFKDVAAQKTKAVDLLAQMMDRYGTVTEVATIRAAKGMDLLFRSYRQLSDAPDLGNLNKIDFSKLPKAPDAGLPGPGGFEEFQRSGRNIGPEGMLTREQADAIKDRYRQVGKAGQAAMRQVSTVITDLSRGIADVIFKGGKFGDMMANVAKQAGQAIVRELIEGALKKLATKLLDVGGIMGKVFGGAGGAGGTIFSAAGSAGGSVAGAAGSAAGGVGGAASAATSSIAGIVGAVGSVVSAVSGVIGNFQMAHMNTALGRIEENTRYTKIWTGEQSQSLLWCAQKSTEYLGYAVKSLDMIGLLNSQMLGLAQAGGGAGGTTINMAGAYLLTDAALDDFIERFSRRLKTQGL